MNKRLITICMTTLFALVMSLQVFAAKQGAPYSRNGHDFRTVSVIEAKDFERFVAVLNEKDVDGKKLGPVENYTGNNGVKNMKIVNAKQLTSNEWVIRVYDEGTQMINGDYLVTARPYETDELGLPCNVPENTERYAAEYGPAWFFCGLFGDGSGTVRVRRDDGTYENPKSDNHQIIGFAIAQRITRWPAWEDLTYGELPNAHSDGNPANQFKRRNPEFKATWTDKDGTVWNRGVNADGTPEAPGKLKREGHDVDYVKSYPWIFTATGFARDSAIRLNAKLATEGKANPALQTFINRFGTVGLVGTYDRLYNNADDWQNAFFGE
jgi:hypothetical protein